VTAGGYSRASAEGQNRVKGSLLAGRYELRNVLGEGGRATVFRAFDQKLGVDRAVKVLRKSGPWAHKPHQVRFEREARILAQFDHPNILRVHEHSHHDADDPPFMVLDFCVGGSLEERIQRGVIPPAQALAYTLQAAHALEHAHRKGVVHRDVKPANLLVDAAGQAVLGDFGIAKDYFETGADTEESATLGTHAFMAPEQRYETSQVDGAADQYAMTATLYVMLTGESPTDLFLADESSPRWWGIPHAVLPVLQRGLQFDPNKRYPGMQAFIRAIHHVAEHLSMEAPDLPAPATAGSAAPELEAWYRSSLGTRAEELRDALRRMDVADDDAGAEVRRIAHIVRGGGAGFGFPLVTDMAQAVETADERDLANRAGELVYVMRSISRTGLTSTVLVACVPDGFPLDLTLVFPDARVTSDWDDTLERVLAGTVDVLLCMASEEVQRGLHAIRASGVGASVVLLGGTNEVDWRRLGVDHVVANADDPVAIRAAVRSLADPRFSRPVIGLSEFYREVSSQLDRFRVEPHDVYVFRVFDIAQRNVIPRRAIHRAKALLAYYHSGMVAVLPTRLADAFTDFVSADSWERSAVASTALRGGESLPSVVGRLLRLVHTMEAPGHQRVAEETKTASVVLIEDDPAMARLVSQVLRSGGAKVRHHADGLEGLEAVLDDVPDLVILDVGLPTLDGVSILLRLREHPDTFDTPVLMLTGRSKEEEVVQLLEMGASDFVAKPFEVAVLNARIRSLLRRSRPGQATR